MRWARKRTSAMGGTVPLRRISQSGYDKQSCRAPVYGLCSCRRDAGVVCESFRQSAEGRVAVAGPALCEAANSEEEPAMTEAEAALAGGVAVRGLVHGNPGRSP